MNRDFTFKRRLILGGIGLLLLADVGLGVYRWHLSSTPATPAQRLAEEKWKLKLQRADIDGAEKIETQFSEDRERLR